MRSLSVRVGGNATESGDKKLHICKHNVINRTHFTCKIGGDGIMRAARGWDLACKQLIIMDVVTPTKAGGGGATCHPSRNGADQLLLSGVRRKLNRGDNRSRVYQPHRWLRPLNPVESSPTGRSCRVGEEGQQVIFSWMLSSTDCRSVCVCIWVCVIDWRFYLTACCSWCLPLCGHQQVSLLGFGRVPVDICPPELRLLFF